MNKQQMLAPALVSEPAGREGALLIEFLRAHDALCPLCKYNLHGLTSPRCPECGNELKLSVSLVEPYQKAWIVLVSALCASAGIGLLFVMLIARMGWPGEGRAIDTAISLSMGTIPLAAAALLLRRRLLRLSRTLQWLLAWTSVALLILCLVLMANIR